MKSKMLLVLTVIAAGLFTSCSQEENLIANETNQQTPETGAFRVIEEQELTAEQLFAATMGQIENKVDEEQFQNIHRLYTEANAALPTVEGNSNGRAKAPSLLPALYKTVRITYPTTDQDGKTVQASALIVYPLLKKIKNVMLINHGTHIGFMLVPSQYTSVEGIMAATGSLCIMPDYIGLGATASHPDLYLNHGVHGVNSVDALITLLDFAQAKRLPLDTNFKSYILGYSQGGSVSLASLREVQRRDKATQQRLHLAKVFCGDGPYDLRRTFETYVEDMKNGKQIGLGAVIPSVINSMFNSYPSEVADMRYEDFFTPWALKTGVPQAIRDNKEGIFDMILKFAGKNLDDILNMEYCESHPDHLNRLLELMDRQNLCEGWKPEYPVKLMHCNPDEVVPFSNFQEAVEKLGNEKVETEVLELKLIKEPLLQHIYGMTVMLEQVLSGNW